MYELLLTRKARKAYEQADATLVAEINACFDRLMQDPYRGGDIKKLKGQLAGYWRCRIGDYRIVSEALNPAIKLHILSDKRLWQQIVAPMDGRATTI